MTYEIFEWRGGSRSEFLRHWSGLYTDPREHLYQRAIGGPYTAAEVMDLFEWKNGGALSRLKDESVRRNFIGRLAELDGLDEETPPQAFLARWAEGGAIWRIFWLHCWKPERFPIYDQHVYRAAARIEGWRRTEMPKADRDRVASYLEDYLPFCQRHGFYGREADKALWAFGKLLRTLRPKR